MPGNHPHPSHGRRGETGRAPQHESPSRGRRPDDASCTHRQSPGVLLANILVGHRRTRSFPVPGASQPSAPSRRRIRASRGPALHRRAADPDERASPGTLRTPHPRCSPSVPAPRRRTAARPVDAPPVVAERVTGIQVRRRCRCHRSVSSARAIGRDAQRIDPQLRCGLRKEVIRAPAWLLQCVLVIRHTSDHQRQVRWQASPGQDSDQHSPRPGASSPICSFSWRRPAPESRRICLNSGSTAATCSSRSISLALRLYALI